MLCVFTPTLGKYFLIKFSIIHSVPPVTSSRNWILSMEVEASMELVLFQSWLTDGTFYTHLPVKICPSPFLNALWIWSGFWAMCEQWSNQIQWVNNSCECLCGPGLQATHLGELPLKEAQCPDLGQYVCCETPGSIRLIRINWVDVGWCTGLTYR